VLVLSVVNCGDRDSNSGSISDTDFKL
jgi:hypothetical protein